MKINYINCIFVEGYFYPHPLEKITAGDWTLIYNYKKCASMKANYKDAQRTAP